MGLYLVHLSSKPGALTEARNSIKPCLLTSDQYFHRFMVSRKMGTKSCLSEENVYRNKVTFSLQLIIKKIVMKCAMYEIQHLPWKASVFEKKRKGKGNERKRKKE